MRILAFVAAFLLVATGAEAKTVYVTAARLLDVATGKMVADPVVVVTDGKISSKDGVYKSLRLWSDKNKDGKAVSGELMSLDQAGVDSISLDADAGYMKRDKYGNITTLRANVRMKNGSNRAIFDVWFALGSKQRKQCGSHFEEHRHHNCNHHHHGHH